MAGRKADAKAGGKESPALDVKVLSVSYPPNEPSLVWQVSSSGSGSARVRISYILGNLNKSFNYRAIAANDEKTLVLSEYIRIQNLANESFGSTGLWAGFGPRFLKPIGINETKEMLVEKYAEVPVKKTYTCDPQAHGYLDRPQNKLLVPMHYVLKNDKANHLGAAPLQFGKVRIFQEDGHGGTAFIGEDWGKFTPLDDEMRLSVGVAQDVVVKRTIDKREQQRVAGNLFDRDVVIKFEIENFKDKADHARHLGKRPRHPQRVVWRQRPRRAVGTGQVDHVRRRARQGEEHLRETALPRFAAGPRRRRQGREDRSQAPPGPQERMVIPMRTSLILAAIALGTVLLAAFAVRAENVDLSTVPARNTVQLTIYNSEDLTLVRETRKVTFKPGANPLQFSWANTLIDPTSVELRFLTHGEKLTVLDTTFPHAKPQMLYWNVQSEMDGEATIEITYFTSGISWSADYIGIADPDESQLNLEGFVRVNNNSGEEYEDAQVRLVVGRINLVQKIAELARIPVAEVAKLAVGGESRSSQRQALREAMNVPMGGGLGGGMRRAVPGWQNPRKSPRKVWASISSIPSKAPRRSPTPGRSGCGAWKRPRCRSRSSIAIAPPNMARTWCGCTS